MVVDAYYLFDKQEERVRENFPYVGWCFIAATTCFGYRAMESLCDKGGKRNEPCMWIIRKALN